MSLNNNKFDALHNSDDSEDEERAFVSEEKKRKDVSVPIVVPNGEHPLQFTYCLWFSRRAPGKHAAPQSFDQNLKMVGRFGSVEQFWSYYCHLVRPCELTGHSDFHLFKDGIKPMWEDDANRWGGKWIVRLRKGLASRCWENLILAMLVYKAILMRISTSRLRRGHNDSFTHKTLVYSYFSKSTSGLVWSSGSR
nr:EOG090X0BMA [Chydorus sphaericus]